MKWASQSTVWILEAKFSFWLPKKTEHVGQGHKWQTEKLNCLTSSHALLRGAQASSSLLAALKKKENCIPTFAFQALKACEIFITEDRLKTIMSRVSKSLVSSYYRQMWFLEVTIDKTTRIAIAALEIKAQFLCLSQLLFQASEVPFT